MVGKIPSARWLTRRNTVRVGGSSRSLRSLLAQAGCMSSGNHTTTTRQPPCEGVSDNLRTSSSLSSAKICGCWFSMPISISHCARSKCVVSESILRHSLSQRSLTTLVVLEAFLGRITGKTKCKSGCAHLCVMAHPGQVPQACCSSPCCCGVSHSNRRAKSSATAMCPAPSGPSRRMACGKRPARHWLCN